MISITSEDLKSFKPLSSGRFGTAYQVDDHTVYKIYHDRVHDEYFQDWPNPALKLGIKRLDRLKRHAKGLKYTDVWDDKVSVDGYFKGFSMPFYDGSLLNSYMHSPFPIKIRLAKELARNGRELAEHLIYPTDYKMNNIMTHQGSVKILDLDDNRTKTPLVPSIYFLGKSTFGLNETIVEFFEEYSYASYGLCVRDEVVRERKHPDHSFQFLEDYLRYKEEPMSFLLVDASSDLNVIGNLLREKDYKVVYLFNGMRCYDDEFIDLIHEYGMRGIPIFDILFDAYEENYFHNFNAVERSEVHGCQFIKK